MLQLPATVEGLRILAMRAITEAVGGEERAELYVQHRVQGVSMRVLARERGCDQSTICRRVAEVERVIRSITGDSPESTPAAATSGARG